MDSHALIADSSDKRYTAPIPGAFSECRHCGQALRSSSERLSGFCCIGCKGVHEFIHSLGLDYYYKLSEQSQNQTPAIGELKLAPFAHFDDPKFKQDYVCALADGSERIQFLLTGIHCAACVWLLERLPEVVPGLRKVRVDFLRALVTLDFDPGLLPASKAAQILSRLGYQPSPRSLSGIVSSRSSDSNRQIFAIRLGVAAFCAMNVMLLFICRYQGIFSGIEKSFASFFAWTSLVISLPSVLFSALPFYQSALSSLRLGKIHIDTPIVLAILGGFIASVANTLLGRSEIYFDTITALVFLLLCGRWCQQHALRHVGDTSDILSSVAPIHAQRLTANDRVEDVYIRSLKNGDRVRVERGDSFPCDGVITKGHGHVSNSILTGESHPVAVKPGDAVLAGAKNLGAAVELETTATGENTRLGGLVASIQSAPTHHSRIARFVDTVGSYFVFVVLALATITFLWWLPQGFSTAWDHVIALLVVSCPCAVGIVAPITLSLATARAARHGILIRDPEAFERLAAAKEILFDKTGTLTYGEIKVADEYVTGPQVWHLLAALEESSQHPVGIALRKAAEQRLRNQSPNDVNSTLAPLKLQNFKTSNFGITAFDASGSCLRVGALDWLKQSGVLGLDSATSKLSGAGANNSLVGLALDSEIVGLFSLNDTLRPNAKSVLEDLTSASIAAGILSGDDPKVVQKVSSQLALGTALGSLTPEAKASRVKHPQTVFVGDGVNDALALSQAGVGVGMSGGAEICLKVAHVYLTRPDLTLIPLLLRASRRTMNQIHLHLLISLFYNATAMTLAITGHIGPLGAAIVMPLSSLSVITAALKGAPFRSEKT